MHHAEMTIMTLLKKLIVQDDLLYIIVNTILNNSRLTNHKKHRLLAMINLLVKYNIIPYIVDIDDPCEIWNKLEGLLALASLTRRLLIGL
jgi:hypothetical protein